MNESPDLIKEDLVNSSDSLWLDSGTSSGCSQMSRFLQQDDLIRFNPVILVIRFSCLIPSSLQVQCLVRDTTTRGILVKGVDRRTEEGGSSLAVHLVVMIFDPASEDDSILESFGANIISSSTKITQGVFLGGAADFCICSYKVVQYLQADVKPDS